MPPKFVSMGSVRCVPLAGGLVKSSLGSVRCVPLAGGLVKNSESGFDATAGLLIDKRHFHLENEYAET